MSDYQKVKKPPVEQVEATNGREMVEDLSVLDDTDMAWNASLQVADVAFSKSYPALATWLFAVIDSAGRQRQLPSLKIWCDKDQVHCLLFRPDTESMAFGNGKTVQEALSDLNSSLANKSATWHRKRPQRPS